MIKLGQMVMKGVIWVHNAEIRSYGLERSQLATLIKLGQMVLKGVIGYTILKSGHLVLKGVNWVHNDKIR